MRTVTATSLRGVQGQREHRQKNNAEFIKTTKPATLIAPPTHESRENTTAKACPKPGSEDRQERAKERERESERRKKGRKKEKKRERPIYF